MAQAMSVEGSQWLPDRSESSKEEDKDLKAKNKAPESRWVRSPLFGAELPKPNQPVESSLRPPLPIEKPAEHSKPEVFAEKVEAAKLQDIPHVTENQPFRGAPSEQWESISGRSPYSEKVEQPVSMPDVSSAVPAAEAFGVPSTAETTRKPSAFMARELTRVVLQEFLDNIKRQRYDLLQQQLQARDERADQLQQQRQAQERAAAQAVHTEAAPDARQPGEQVLFDHEGNEITLQPGWHVERSPGGFSVVLDEHGRVVHDAIKYGEAFRREQQREQLSDDLFNAISSGGAIGIPATDSINDAAQQQPGPQQPTTQYTGYEALPPEMVDLRHRLPKPRLHAADTLTSPWLWTAVAILIIIYFVASLA